MVLDLAVEIRPPLVSIISFPITNLNEHELNQNKHTHRMPRPLTKATKKVLKTKPMKPVKVSQRKAPIKKPPAPRSKPLNPKTAKLTTKRGPPKITRAKAKAMDMAGTGTNQNIQQNQQLQGATLQPHLAKAMKFIPNTMSRNSRVALSKNTITPNPKIAKLAKAARYGAAAGMDGPEADHFRPITNPAPRAVMDRRQLLLNTSNNLIPDEFGITNPNAFPMQQLIPTAGGKHSGRTGAIR